VARRARLDAPGTLHHVIVRGKEKRRIGDDVADRKNFVKSLGELSAEIKRSCQADWCVDLGCRKNHKPGR
jgi:hypothetical protein